MAQLTQAEIIKRCQAGESCSGENLANLDLANQSLAGIDLSAADLSGTDLRNTDLTEANLNDANLTGADLSGATLHRTYLVGCNLTDANLEAANLRGAFLSGSLLCGTNFKRADLRRATLGCPQCEVPGPFGSLTSFENANLEEAIFGEIKLKGTVLLGANLKMRIYTRLTSLKPSTANPISKVLSPKKDAIKQRINFFADSGTRYSPHWQFWLIVSIHGLFLRSRN